MGVISQLIYHFKRLSTMDKEQILDVLVKFQLENTKDFYRTEYLEDYELREWIENYLRQDEKTSRFWKNMAKDHEE